MSFPEGREWRCPADILDPVRREVVPCGYSKPEHERGTGDGCPRCGGPLSRIVAQL